MFNNKQSPGDSMNNFPQIVDGLTQYVQTLTAGMAEPVSNFENVLLNMEAEACLLVVSDVLNILGFQPETKRRILGDKGALIVGGCLNVADDVLGEDRVIVLPPKRERVKICKT